MCPAATVSNLVACLAGFIFFPLVCSAEQQQNVPWKIYMTQHLSVIHTAFIKAVNSAIYLTRSHSPEDRLSHAYLFLLALIPLIVLFCGFFSPHINCTSSLLHQEL